MGHKVHPKVFRLLTTTTWGSRWFVDRRQYRSYLEQDTRIRQELRRRLRDAQVEQIDIERSANTVTITIRAARPGVVIGRGGQGIEGVKRDLRERYLGGASGPVLQVNVVEVDRPALSAEVAVHQIIADFEKRLPFRRTLRQALGRIERASARGARIQASGRLDGAEIARREAVMFGSVPLHTIRADVDYAQGFARTIYGSIGVKVWINRGEVFAEKKGLPKGS